MKVILAKTAGFCKGVRRAMNMVLEANENIDGPLYTDGPLIHNPQTIEVLERRGIRVMGKDQNLGPDQTLFIRTHGIAPQRREELRNLGVSLCDATCPDVAKIQGLIRRYSRAGYLVVIVGDSGHAEVVGLEGYAEGKGLVVGSAEQVGGLPPADKVCVVAQSTLDPQTYDQVSEELRARYREVLVLDTICRSTQRRQEELLQLARSADAVVVVGGKNSANTCRLVEISNRCHTPTFHVETADELDARQMRHFRTVGVTAGASTPNWILMSVVEKLRAIEYEAVPRVLRYPRQAFRFLVKANFFIALGAALLCYANVSLMGLTVGWIPYAVAFCYILSIHLLTHLTDQGVFELSRTRRFFHESSQRRVYVPLAAVSMAGALVLAALKGTAAFIIVLLLSALGTIYRLDILPLRLSIRGKKFSLRQIPASKDLFMALGWTVVTLVLPLLASGHSVFNPAFGITFVFTFILVVTRSLFFDVRDLQGDQIVGRETLPTIIGTPGTQILLIGLTCLQALVLALGTALGWITGPGYLMLVLPLYICAYLLLYHKRVLYRGISVEVIGDMQFVLAGALALFYHLFTG
ncbi:MAG: 4-hydroxy-3-methylbut-2-enyl diphosphate reductase [Candidatus Glassbacteria bacterium]|nr:4-hydroxy-3-methylbut-2-enyl diphosphate reductase [Candidatus Glassbacteria bacterium]